MHSKSIISLLFTSTACAAISFDYIVVGGGTGGGTVATELAMKGYATLLIEAGPDHYGPNNSVPIFNARASEDPEISFGFDVRHYDDSPKTYFYPRNGALGGCSTHNAMISVYPNTRDFELMKEITGDSSWDEKEMREYYKRIERNQYILGHSSDGINDSLLSSTAEYLLGTLGKLPEHISSLLGLDEKAPEPRSLNSHGFNGWYSTSYINFFRQLKLDKQLVNLVALALGNPIKDVNGYGLLSDRLNTDKSGKIFVPMAVDTAKYTRVNFPEYIRRVASDHPLTIWTDTFVTKVIFDSNNTATGVEYKQGKYLYKASPLATDENRANASLGSVYAKREIIVSGGTFNTPQLLMLSGVGDKKELAKFGISSRADLPGVGRNLMDRYEVSVVTEYPDKFTLARDCKFTPTADDPCYQDYANHQKGPYISNAVIGGELFKSDQTLNEPNLFALNAISDFHGYFRGYSTNIALMTNCSSRVLLMAHTNNTNGQVALASADPFDMPEINFRSFSDGDGDLEILVNAVKDARKFSDGLIVSHSEKIPGKAVQTDEEIRNFIKDVAWGHHASCTAKMGLDNDPLAVLDGRFRVRKVNRLRVVDASAFPKIPGYFPVLYLHMFAMKAADYIAADAINMVAQ